MIPKRHALIIALALLALAFAVGAQAQETYTYTLGGTAANTRAAKQTMVGKVNLGRLQWNRRVCEKGSLPATCTQAQACAALGVTGGAACTAADALAADARIFPDSLVGRQSFQAEMMIRRMADAYYQEQIALDKADALNVCPTANDATLTAICTAFGLPGDCFVCGR